jgi:hypothetical protein
MPARCPACRNYKVAYCSRLYHIIHMIWNATLVNPDLFLNCSLIMRKLRNFSMAQMLHILGEY